MTFHVGQRVVCVVGLRPKNKGRVSDGPVLVGIAKNPRYPQKGETYTVRHVNDIHTHEGDRTLILLNEVRNDHLTDFIRNGLEPGFISTAFEPVSA